MSQTWVHWVLTSQDLLSITLKADQAGVFLPVEPVSISYRLPVDARGGTRCVFSNVVF